MVTNPEIFNYLETQKDCVLERKPFEELAKNKEVNAYKYHGFWQCMDTQRDRHKLEELWENILLWKIWK